MDPSVASTVAAGFTAGAFAAAAKLEPQHVPASIIAATNLILMFESLRRRWIGALVLAKTMPRSGAHTRLRLGRALWCANAGGVARMPGGDDRDCYDRSMVDSVRGFAFSVVLLGCACATKPPAVRQPPSSPALTLDAAERARILSAIGPAIEAHYVFPDVGAQMTAMLRDRIARGDYDRIVDGNVLAARVTDDLRAVSHDRHVMLEALPESPASQGASAPSDSLDALKAIHFGIGPVERLDGNVARLVIDSFEDPRLAAPAIADAMNAIAGADAILIDLRANHGGNPWGVAHVASYFFDGPPIHWNDLYWRDDDSTQKFFTDPNVPGKRIGATRPLYVLVGAQTFSAAEEFAYGMQAQKRAVLVGATTKGGAHPVCPTAIGPHYSMRVPCGRAINPITHGNWEGTGVIPDVIVNESDAVREAEKRALAAIRAHPSRSSAAGPDSRRP
jgi:retinol-binding protein 3